ncbi:MAG: hypothetical protein ACYCX3_14900, partial [Thermoleophilia bacterium]
RSCRPDEKQPAHPFFRREDLESTGFRRLLPDGLLGILLEPLYWPAIVGKQTRSAIMTDEEYEAVLATYGQKARGIVAQLDPEEWQRIHESLRYEATETDDNGALYLLLRLSKWAKRENLRGRISLALWIRHMAETLRRAFADVHGVEWLEEDQAFGYWPPGARTVAYGSDRPLDAILESRPRLAFHFGLATGSSVRWYVEGATEYQAILAVLEEPHAVGVELVNLRGNLASERDNIALKLSDGLKQDCALSRFSIISFDTDVPANVRTVRMQVQQNNVVGLIAAHTPDFEFANFTVAELTEIAARLDEAHCVSGDPVRSAEWADVDGGRRFEQCYMEVSERRPAALKGEEWGRALAEYAGEYPRRADSQTERPFWHQIRAALQARTAHYDVQKQDFHFDPETFELVDHREGAVPGVTSG